MDKTETDPDKRIALLQQCFDLQLQGYRSETDIPEDMLKKLPLFIDMVLIENIVDEFECCEREGEELDYEDIENAAQCLIKLIPYTGFGQSYIIGRIEAIADQKRSILRVKNIWFESDTCRAEKIQTSINQALARLPRFNDCAAAEFQQ